MGVNGSGRPGIRPDFSRDWASESGFSLGSAHCQATIKNEKGRQNQPGILIEVELEEPAMVGRYLTDAAIRSQGFVVETEDRSKVVEVGVLGDQVPLGVVHPVVEVRNRDLHSPVLLVVELDMPVHSYRTHVGCTLH